MCLSLSEIRSSVLNKLREGAGTGRMFGRLLRKKNGEKIKKEMAMTVDEQY